MRKSNFRNVHVLPHCALKGWWVKVPSSSSSVTDRADSRVLLWRAELKNLIGQKPVGTLRKFQNKYFVCWLLTIFLYSTKCTAASLCRFGPLKTAVPRFAWGLADIWQPVTNLSIHQTQYNQQQQNR